MAAGDTVGSKFLLEPSLAVGSVTMDTTATGTIAAATSGTVAITTGLANTVILVFAAITSGAKVTSVSDTRSLAWNKLSAASFGAAIRGEVWWAFEPTAQTHTITLNLSVSANAALVAVDYGGLNTALPVDPQALVATTGTGTAPSTSSTNMNPNDILLGFVACVGAPTLTVGAGYTTLNSVAQSTNVSAGAEWRLLTASAATTVNYTLGTSQSFVLTGFALMASGNNFQTVQPSAGVEEVIHDVEGSGPYAIMLTDGVNTVLVDVATGPKWDSNLTLHLTNAQYMVIANTSATSPGWFGFDGVQTK